MTSSHSNVRQISTELKQISLKRHQLLERKKMQELIEELKIRGHFGKTDETVSNDVRDIDEEVKQLTERELELQKSLDKTLSVNDKKEVNEPSSQKADPDKPASSASVIFVEAPPSFPAPKVYLDLENLPCSPCRTQCPECSQFVLTETTTTISSVTWLACLSIACLGGVVGCCLIPFCFHKFKSTKHKCPLCRTSIQNMQNV